jgi:hypothetical protein
LRDGRQEAIAAREVGPSGIRSRFGHYSRFKTVKTKSLSIASDRVFFQGGKTALARASDCEERRGDAGIARKNALGSDRSLFFRDQLFDPLPHQLVAKMAGGHMSDDKMTPGGKMYGGNMSGGKMSEGKM